MSGVERTVWVIAFLVLLIGVVIWAVAMCSDMRVRSELRRCPKTMSTQYGGTVRCVYAAGHEGKCSPTSDDHVVGEAVVQEDERGLSISGVIWGDEFSSYFTSTPSCADGTSGGIVHRVDIDEAPIVAGQGVFSKGTRVELREGFPDEPGSTGCVLHYDASPDQEAAIIRWGNGIVTVELDLTVLEVIA